MDKPRIAQVLGVKVNENFKFNDFPFDECKVYFVGTDGEIRNAKGGSVTGGELCYIINNPDRIIRKPRWTEQEVDMATLLIDFRGSGSVTVGRQVNGPLWWRGENDEHGLLPREFFPSLRPGQSVTLDEIIGGVE